MNPFSDIRVILSLIGTALLVVGLVLGGQQILTWKKGYEENQQRASAQRVTTELVDDGVQADQERAATDQGVSSAREQFTHDLKEAKHVPEVADRASRPVPHGVRNALHKRRLARERIGCAGVECGTGPEAKDPAQR